jgi:hypothetical protein
MISIGISSNVQDTIRQLNARRDQVPFATAVALTRTAVKVKDAEYKEMVDVFDRPTPYTLNSLYAKGATKQNLEAVVWLKYDTSKGTPADKYLTPEISGGQRRLKRFERALRSVGALPDGYFAVPGAAAKMDAYGNMATSQIVQILSYFRAFRPEIGYHGFLSNITDKRKAKLARGTKRQLGFEYFVGSPGDRLPLGVWQRFGFARGSAIKPILIFVKSAHYPIRLDFGYVAQQTVNREFSGEFQRALAEATASAH